MDLNLVIDMVAEGNGDRVVISSDGLSLTAQQLRERAEVLGDLVRESRASALYFVGPNSAVFPICLFAAARAGVPLVPLNYRLSTEQLSELVAVHPRSVVVHDAVVGLTSPADARELTTDEVLAISGSSREAFADSASSLDPELPEDGIAVLLYTSGTTAAPKAAVLRHRHVMSYVLGTIEFSSAAEDEATLVTVPPYHIAGVMNLVTSLYAGRRVVYLDSFTAADWVKTVREQSVTQAFVVPTMLARIVDHLATDPATAPSLRTLSYGGARMPLPVLERAMNLFPHTGFVNAYGLTETSSTIALLGPDDHRRARSSDDPAVRSRLGSVGQLLPGVELQVRTEDGSVLQAGEVGLIFLRGEQISGEYSGIDAEETQGWFATRDRGWVDAEGYLFIEGRADDTIIRGGENIAPAEIEDALLQHPFVVDAVVVGIPDDEWGQRLAAMVVCVDGSTPDTEEIRSWVRSRLRSSKTPDLIAVRSELPRTDTGKLLRRKVLEELTG